MSTGEPPEDDPFLKKPSEPPSSGGPGPGQGATPGGGPYGGPGAGAPGGGPYGSASGGVPPSGGPYGGDPYGGAGAPGGGPGNPYGDQSGATDPLAGMPPLAARWRRLVARIIDGLLVSIPVSAVFSAATWGWDWDLANNNGKSTSLGIIIAVVYFVYEGLMLTTRGQTVGKMAMHIRVAMLENGAVPEGTPGWTRAAVYSLPEVVPCCGFVFWLVNVLWCTWDMPYHQCIHDKAAKTVVVSTAQ
ncbi:RDD family protein [Streptomyces olivoreticuli]|uniref:RDD family protein n=1 Tax=Streptomyces olivoreticuli TaxID=68246 RepID=UPI000E289480|nr:RDD family protein [Streptomyces olivoreticuli]